MTPLRRCGPGHQRAQRNLEEKRAAAHRYCAGPADCQLLHRRDSDRKHFSWPGMGTMIVNAINNRDYMLIQGVVLFFALVFVVVNLLVDIAYMLINPRVSYEGGSK